MKLSKNRTCNNCRAALPRGKCALGFATDIKRTCEGVAVEFHPIEPCCKPKTYDKYIAAQKIIYNQA